MNKESGIEMKAQAEESERPQVSATQFLEEGHYPLKVFHAQ
jgi:HEPN domain-containing protein